MSKYVTVANILWAMAYLAMVLLIVWKMNQLKASVPGRLETADAKADWEKWREDSTKPGPVARRKPKSEEPPALVLLREHYGTCLSAALFFSTLLFVVSMLFIRGAFAQGNLPEESKIANE